MSHMEGNWMRRIAGALLVLLLATAGEAPAQTRAGLMKDLEGSMLLKGRIDVGADGRVTGFTIQDSDHVDPDALAHVMRHVPHWRVHPATVDGIPVASSSPFSLRLVAKRRDDGLYDISMTGVSIREDLPAPARLRAREMGPPTFPPDVMRMGGSGIAYLLLKIDATGKVIDTHVEQVDLTVLARRQVARQIRERLGQAALAAVRGWSFIPPTSGPEAGKSEYVLRVPVQFALDGKPPGYGMWTAHVPGERTPAGWARDDGGQVAGEPGMPALAGTGLHLRSELEPGS